MRVTDSFRYRTVTRNLNNTRERLTDIQEQLASGKRLNKPSDNPTDMANALKLRTILESNFQYEENIKDSITQLTAQEEGLNQVYEVLANLKEITIQGASDSITIRESIADQVGHMLENMLEIANTKFNGKYIYGGTETLNRPFVLNENVINNDVDAAVVDYYGNNEQAERQINENTIVPINISGKEIFDQSAGGGVNIFQMMYDLKRSLENDDTVEINAKIDEVDSAIEQSLKSFLKIGTRKQLVYFNEDRFMSQNIQVRAALSNIEDTDYGTAFVEFKAEENALNSALSAGARVVSPSLLDFLGAV
ncbi:flagellar hook-associated protein FlgL [candidate division KSB1 bacterium]